ncbi:MAG: hypothetical protein F4W95_10845 [Chloroflexi bacterium]|nr:hypothetical protein [Chloroflexota bacterium]MYD48968.1 hypothetical protein [Chloroflexota bacterium]
MHVLESALAYPVRQRPNRRRAIVLGTLPLLLALILVVLWNVHAQSPSLAVVEASGDGNESATGPCEDGWIAPTPVAVAVAAVPVVVSSTTADYFVLYVTIPSGPDTTRELPISVTRGEAGKTTLTDRLQPLSADKYRVEKYQVASPGDLDGDCIDDITELDGMGAYNPLNTGKKIGIEDGSIAVDSEDAFNALYYRGHSTDKFTKFVILDFDGANPYVYFINVNKYNHHDLFVNEWNIPPRSGGSHTIYGSLTYGPNVVASDGSLGVYYYTLTRGYTYWQAHQVNELLAAAMPLLENNLAYKPHVTPRPTSLEAKHTDARLVILEDKDIHPDVAFVSLNQAEGYGLLRLMEDGDEPRPIDIAIYKSLPNDLPRVAGTITTIPQTPLSHVNLRAIQNNVPNAFIRDILKDETLKALIGKHVYYAVTKWGYTLREATKKEVDDHHASERPTKTQTPERDLTVTKITALADISFDDWDAFGVKAANMAELSKLSLPTGTVPTGHAVPFYFYDEFMKNAELSEKTLFGKKKWPDADKLTLPAGTKLSAAVTQILAHPRFQADYEIQEEMLDDLRDAIKDAESPDWIIKALEGMHATYPDGQSLRYRSSTNNEDLPAFNGAGLYSSKTQDPDETTKDGIDKSIKAVWASLWNFRAFLEREYYRVDHATTAMGVLVHPNFADELANGVAVSTDPIRLLDDMYYVNTQVGEDLVTNPQPNSFPEELLLDANGNAILLSRSSLAKQGSLLMTDAQMVQLRNNLKTIHDRFKTLYNVKEVDDFAIEIEFKITADNKLAIKQARPWVFPPPLSLTPAVTVPTYSATAPSTKENRFMRFNLLKLIPNEHVKWSMTGPDADMFILRVVSDRRELYFRAQDYENPEDADGDNVYRIVLTATDSDGGKTTTIDFSVTVYNDPDDDSGKLPVLSIHSLKDIGEGGPARFIITADPVPEAWFTIGLDVTEDGDYAARVGWDTTHIDIGDTSSHFTVWTINDDTEEPDGSVTATLVPGTGYTISADKGAATVNVSDNDGPPTPEVSVTAGSGVTEGGSASFTVTASPAPTAPLSISVTVTASGDYGATTGSQTVTIPTAGSATVTVGTTDDDTDETDGSVSVSVDAEDGYTVSASQGTATVSVADNDDPPPATPEISVTAGSGVTEGGDATFTVTATPAPSEALSVSVTVIQDGDFGATTGAQTVSIPTSGSATVTVSTTDDDTDETDGSVSVTVDAGDGYTVSTTQGAATVGVADNDDPPPAAPEVNISGATSGEEGQDVTFTLLATPAPATPLAVSVTVTASGDFGVTTGAQTVTIPTGGSATLPLSTTDDNADEPNGSVTLTLNSGSHYTVGSLATETAPVLDNDDAPLAVEPEVSVTAGNGITEGGDASFTVTASPAPSAPLSVSVTVTQQGDYGATTGTQTVTVTTSGSATVTVGTTDDSADEPNGSVSVSVNAGDGYTVSPTQGAATISVADNDAAPVIETKPGLPAFSSGHVGLISVKVSEQIKYTPPTLNLNGVGACTIGVGLLLRGSSVVRGTDNGFKLSVVGGVPRMAGRAQAIASPTRYTLEYVCGAPQGWRVSYTIDVQVVPSGMTFRAASLNHVKLVKDQRLIAGGHHNRPISPPELLFAEGEVAYAISPALPSGLALDAASGVISGTPTAVQDQATYTVTATDSKSGGAQTASYTVGISVFEGMRWAVSSLPDQVFEAGERIEIDPPQLLDATASVIYGHRASGPSVLHLHPYSGRLLASSADPMVKNTYTVTAMDAGVNRGPRQQASFTVNVEVIEVHYLGAGQAVNIPPMKMPSLSGAITYSLPNAPALPTGLSFDSSTGVTSGTLDAIATQAKQTYTVTGTDENGVTADYRFKIEVRKLVVSGAQPSYSVGAGDPLSISPTHSGEIGAVSYSISPAASELPDGVGFNTETGAISGTPAVEFAEKSFTVTAADGADPPQTVSYSVSIKVNPSAKAPRVAITAGSGITEGGNAQFTVTASPAPSYPTIVNLTVSQQGDYGAATGTQTVSIPTSGSATVTVGTTDDSADETDGSVSVRVKAGDRYSVSTTQSAATVSVADNDDPPPATPEVSVTAGSGVTEGGDTSFTVTASPAPSAPLSVNLTVSQQGDFGATTGSQTVSVPTSGGATVTVGTTDDSADEPDGSVSVRVEAGDGYTVSATQGTAMVNVADNDDPPPAPPEISVTAGSGITEGSNASFTVTASPAPSAPLSVNLTVGQAGDYGATTGSQTVTIPTSGSATVTVGTTDDSADEPDGSVSVSVNAGDGYTVSTTQSSALVNVADNDDPPPTPEISVTAGSGITEGGDASFAVTASPAPSAPLSVSVTVSQQGDYGATTGTRTVSIPTSGSATVPVGTTDDSADEPDGSVSVAVEAGDGYTVSTTQGTATVSVADNDDPPPTPEISIAAGSRITEGGDASFTITANPAPTAPLTVNVSVSQDGDFGATTGAQTVSIPTSGSATVTVGTSDDSADEPDGSVSVAVDAGDGYTVSGSQGTATVNVDDNDDPPPQDLPEVSISDASVVEGEHGYLSPMEFTLTLSKASDEDMTVYYRVHLDETKPSDHHGGSSRVKIYAGRTQAVLVVLVVDDKQPEGDETLIVELTEAEGAVIADDNTAVGTIVDND